MHLGKQSSVGLTMYSKQVQALAYGYRPPSGDLKYLCPWEFVRDYQILQVVHPGKHACAVENAPVLSDGCAPVPGVHFKVREPSQSDVYFTFPDIIEDSSFRHMWILIPWRIPRVPLLTHCPVPSWSQDQLIRTRLLSVYYRPWTLLTSNVCAFVPMPQNLDVVPWLRRIRSKSPSAKCYRQSWRWYVRGHVVSDSAARMITHVLLQMPSDSKEIEEADEADPGTNAVDSVDDVKVCLDPAEVQEPIRSPVVLADEQKGTRSKQVQSAVVFADSVWNVLGSDDQYNCSKTSYHIPHLDALVGSGRQMVCAEIHAGSERERIYPVLNDMNAAAWRHDLQLGLRGPRPGNSPDQLQMQVLDVVLNRCALEAHEERTGNNNVSAEEPVRMLVHGLPGSGKSCVIHWIKDLFETALGWKHGVEFQCAAPMNTMAALIGGVTVHKAGRLTADLS